MTTSISKININSILKTIALILVFCFAANDSYAQYQLPSKYQIKKTPKYTFNKPIQIYKPSCPDLKAMPIEFSSFEPSNCLFCKSSNHRNYQKYWRCRLCFWQQSTGNTTLYWSKFGQKCAIFQLIERSNSNHHL